MPSGGAFRHIRLGNQRAFESVLGRLAQPLFAERHRADLTRQAEFAECDQRTVDRRVEQTRTCRQHDGQIARGFRQPHAAHHVREHVLAVQLQPGVAVCHREQHGEAVAVDAHGDAAGDGAQAQVGEHLHLDQQRTGALAHHGDDAAGYGLGVFRQEDRRRVGHLAQPLLHHGEHADLIGGAEPVLDRPQHPVAAAGIALEVEHRVDHVLEHPWTGDLPLLGDVADEQHRGARALGEADQLGRAFAQLRNGTRAPNRCVANTWSASESTMSTRAAAAAAAATISSTQVSAISRSGAAASPSRRARSATCCTDSSPVAYSTAE